MKNCSRHISASAVCRESWTPNAQEQKFAQLQQAERLTQQALQLRAAAAVASAAASRGAKRAGVFGGDSDSDSLSSLSPFPESLRLSKGSIVKRRRWPELEREPASVAATTAAAAVAAPTKPPQSKPIQPVAPFQQKPTPRQPMHRWPGKPRGPHRQRTESATSSSECSSLSALSNFSDTHPVSTRLAKI